MSIQYCTQCDKYIDTDLDAEHFEQHEDCELKEVGTFWDKIVSTN